MPRSSKWAACRFSLYDLGAAFTGVAIAIALARNGFVAHSSARLVLAALVLACSAVWLVASHPLRQQLRLSRPAAFAVVLAVSTMAASLLYVASFGPSTMYLCQLPKNHTPTTNLYVLVYHPLAKLCPNRLMNGYAQKCGLSEVEAFFLVQILREKQLIER